MNVQMVSSPPRSALRQESAAEWELNNQDETLKRKDFLSANVDSSAGSKRTSAARIERPIFKTVKEPAPVSSNNIHLLDSDIKPLDSELARYATKSIHLDGDFVPLDRKLSKTPTGVIPNDTNSILLLDDDSTSLEPDAVTKRCEQGEKTTSGTTMIFDDIEGEITFFDCQEDEAEDIECAIGETTAVSTEAVPPEKILRPEEKDGNSIEDFSLTLHDIEEGDSEGDPEIDERDKSHGTQSTVQSSGTQSTLQTESKDTEDSSSDKSESESESEDIPGMFEMKAEKIEAFFFNNGMTVCLGVLFLALNYIAASHAAFQFTEAGGFTTDDDILRVTLPIARAGGRLVTLNCAIILLTACKYTWTMIRTYVAPIIPIGFPFDDIMPKYHRFVALWIIIFGCIIHTLPQIVNYTTGAIKIDDGSKIWTFGDGFATRQLLITGSLLTLIFTLFFLTTRKAFRATAAGFRWFWLFHVGGIALAYPLLIVHGTCRGHPIFLYTALTPLMVYLFDVVMRRSKITNTKILGWKTHCDGDQRITELIVECPPNFAYSPGQYAELKFKMISKHEWHPFSIASTPTSGHRTYDGRRVKVMIFYIKATGRWTEALYNYASAFDLSKATKSMDISLRGPHGAPSMNFFEYKHIIVIGSGVGVTPLLSVWQYMMDVGRSKVQQDESLSGSTLSTITSYQSLVTLASNMANADKPREENESDSEASVSTFRTAISRTEQVLDSLTVSIFLFIFFLVGETMMIATQIHGNFVELAVTEIMFATLSLTFHATTMIVSKFGVHGGPGYFNRFKFRIEFGIALIDAANLWLSISVAEDREYIQKWLTNPTLLIVGLNGITVLFHAVRVFHIFYTILKPRTEKRQPQSRVGSIQGIFINRQYSGMRFCFEQLLQPLEEEFLSRVFSLQFYGTREKSNLEHSSRTLPDGDGGFDGSNSILSTTTAQTYNDYFRFYNGRPDWESIFQKAIQKALLSDPNGESIGVFFCGSPAIAKSLRATADKVNARHQFAARRKGRTCRCKIVVHVESF